MVSRNALRVLIIGLTAATVAACSSSGPQVSFKQRSKEYFSQRHYGPASPRVVNYGPVPKGGGHVVVGDAYRVAGRTYIPRDNPRYSATGLASWYGEAFHGRLTANGEVYDVNGITAAHPTMPLPSYARVTNLQNGRSMIVRINDRGPFAHDRIIDLSSRVADMLDMKDRGTARVQVDYVGPARMDGLDQRMLLASYQGPSDAPGNSMFAWVQPKGMAAPVVLAAAAPLPRIRPDLVLYPPRATAFQEPLVLMPAYAPSDGDLLAPLILRSGLVNSYASDATLSPAQYAADDLANARFKKADLQAAVTRAAARKALQLGIAPAGDAPGEVVQIGSFADPANAKRIAADFGRFGRVESDLRSSGGLTVVRVVVDASVAPSAVVDAAADAGLLGAFVLAR